MVVMKAYQMGGATAAINWLQHEFSNLSKFKVGH
jgi:hypothetical protein